MKYYTPRILILFILIVALLNASGFPLTGFWSARYQYTLFDYGYIDQDTWETKRNNVAY